MSKCICEGNWRKIVEECEELFDKTYQDEDGNKYIFVGLMHSPDDYYYAMLQCNNGKLRLLSCVGDIEKGYGFKLMEEEDGT